MRTYFNFVGVPWGCLILFVVADIDWYMMDMMSWEVNTFFLFQIRVKNAKVETIRCGKAVALNWKKPFKVEPSYEPGVRAPLWWVGVLFIVGTFPWRGTYPVSTAHFCVSTPFVCLPSGIGLDLVTLTNRLDTKKMCSMRESFIVIAFHIFHDSCSSNVI